MQFSSIGVLNQDELVKLGRWGEGFAFNLLVRENYYTSVIWKNEEAESGFPYDIVAMDVEGNSHYVEVKTTVVQEKVSQCEISPKEVEHSQREENYHLMRILLNSQEKKIAVFWIYHLRSALEQGRAQLYLIMKQ